uniref:RING-type E3 ubiquitin transferase n=1 Tax=Strongyloides papillosus TaxID=174720 RepID=A0A0N5BRA4_STREA
MARLFPADIVEIIRASNRDDEHISTIIEIIIKNLRLHLNPRKFLQYSCYAPVIGKIIYYASTSLFKKQTLGEEYMNLVQVVSRSRRELPSAFVHIIFILLEGFSTLFEKYFSKLTLSYYVKCRNYLSVDEVVDDDEMDTLFEKYFSKLTLSYYVKCRNYLSVDEVVDDDEMEYLLVEWRDIIKNYISPIIEKLHLSYFYLIDNNFYSIPKRITNIKYFSLSPNTSIQIQKLLYYIGVLNFILSLYLILDGGFKMYKKYCDKKNHITGKNAFSSTNKSNKTLLDKYLQKSKFTCPLCLQISFPASTPCGHIYCFTCLTTGALKDNSRHSKDDGPLRCPQCRHGFTFSRIIPLLNY